jgi:hypothetical protein
MKKIINVRLVYFGIIYILVFFSLTIAYPATKDLPKWIGSLCFYFPQMMFPFGNLYWKQHPIFFNNWAAILAMVFYLILLSLLFSFLTRSIKTIKWTILLAFGFSIIFAFASSWIFKGIGRVLDVYGN